MEKEITIASKDGSEANATDYKSMYEQLQSEFTRIKSANDKLSSENADYKRSERERMTEEQKRNADIAEKEKHYAEIERENAMYKYKASLSGVIKDDKVLTQIAECYANGDVVGALTIQNAYLAKDRSELEKTIKAELLKQNPEPSPAGTNPKLTKDEIMAVKNPIERQKLIAQNIDLFR